MNDLPDTEKNKLARGLIDTVIKTCELHGMEFVNLPYKLQLLLKDTAHAGMVYGAKVMKEAIQE